MTFLFRASDGYVAFLVVLLGFLLHGFGWISSPNIPLPENSSLSLLGQQVQSLFPYDPIPNMALAFLIQLAIIFIFHGMVRKHELLPNDNWAGTLALTWSFALFPSQQFLSIHLFALLFTLLSIFRVLSSFRSDLPNMPLFEAGILLGIAVQLLPETLLLLPVLWIAQGILRVFSLREWLLILIGITLPFYLTGFVFFLNDQFDVFIQSWVYALKPEWFLWDSQMTEWLLIPSGIFLLFFFAGILDFSGYRNKLMLKIRKTHVVFFWWFCLALFLIAVSGQHWLNSIWMISIPMSLYVGVFLSRYHFIWIKEVFAWLLSGSIIFFQYSTL